MRNRAKDQKYNFLLKSIYRSEAEDALTYIRSLDTKFIAITLMKEI